MGVRDWIRELFTTQKPKTTEQPRKPSAPQASYTLNQSNGFYNGTTGGAKWPYGLSSSGSTRIIDHHISRQNVRDMYHESMDARAIIDRMADNVVDTGLKIEATPNARVLGITEEQAEQWSEEVEERFHLFSMDKKQHRAQNMNFYQSQHLYALMQQRDNDMFTRLYYSKKNDLQNPLQFEFIDPNQIRGMAWTSTYAQTSGDDGILRNPDGSERAYKIWYTDPSKPGKYVNDEIPRVGQRSKRIMMLHGYKPEYAGQHRGYPRLSVAIQELENLTDFSAAAIKKAINQSQWVFSVENQQQDPGDPLENMTTDSPIGAAPTTTSQQSSEIIDEIAGPTVCPIPEANFSVPGSAAFVGNSQGDNIKMLETKAPGDNFREFVTTFSERLAAALSIPQEVVLMKFGNSFSASRATLLLFWRIVQTWRQEMATDYLNPVYEMWLTEEIASGRIKAPGFLDPVLRAAWLSCQWIGSPIPSIDPAKEAKAMKDRLEMNVTTLQREARNINGTDAMANIRKNRATFEDLPVPPWGKNAMPEVEEQEEQDDDDMEDDDG